MNYLKRLWPALGVSLLVILTNSPTASAVSSYSWTNDSSLTGNSATSTRLWTSVTSSADGQRLVALEEPDFMSSTGGGIWTSADAGTHWTDVSSLPANSGTVGLSWTSVASSASGQKVVAVANGGGVWTSNDWGATWAYVANFTMSGGLWAGVTVSADGTYMHAMPTNGDVWSSSDGGDTWRNDTWLTGNGSTHQDWQAVDSSADGQKVVGLVTGGGIWVTEDQGITWINNSTLPANSAMNGRMWRAVAVSANGQKIVAAASGNDIWTSNDGGTTWTNASGLPGNGGTAGRSWQAVAISADGQNMVAAARGDGIWASNDSGITWARITAGGPLDTLAWTGLASNITSGRLVAVDNGFFSGGDIYSGVDSNLPQTISASVASPVTAATMTVLVPSTTALTCSSAIAEASLSKQDTGYDYPLGLINVCYTTLLSSDQVTLTFVTDLAPSQVIARDYNTATQTYVTIPGAVITQVTSGGHPALRLTYTITDNGALDSNSLPNFVTDPVGLAVVPMTTANNSVKAPVTGFGMPAQSDLYVWQILFSAIISTGAGVVLFYRRQHQ